MRSVSQSVSSKILPVYENVSLVLCIYWDLIPLAIPPYLCLKQLFGLVKSTLNSAAVLSPTHFTQNHACIFLSTDVDGSQAVKHFTAPFISKA